MSRTVDECKPLIYGSGSDEGVMMAVACIECGLALIFIWSIASLTRQQKVRQCI